MDKQINELNLKQVKKALECWASGNPCEGSCCPLFEISPDTCDRWIGRNALALINELTEENQKYKDQLCLLNARIYELQLELETAKDQVINKFAERVKKYYSTLGGNTNSTLVAYHIDQIAEEMREGIE